jgi:hypothetical protein
LIFNKLSLSVFSLLIALITNLPPGFKNSKAFTTGFQAGVVSMIQSISSGGVVEVSPTQSAPNEMASSRDFSFLAKTKTLEEG